MTEKILGAFEFKVLSAVAERPRDCYGIRIVEAIEDQTGSAPSIGAVYSTLDRLEKKGLVKSEWGEPTAERGGRRKRFYRVTGTAYRALANTRQAFSLPALFPSLLSAAD